MSTSRRGEVLAALRSAEGGVVSGETLAATLGVSRVAVAKHVHHLRELGYEIPAVPGEGYRLVSSLDALVAEEVAALVRSPLVREVVGGGVTSSTNDDAKRLAVAGAPEITAVIASGQTAGRGRLGRTWESPAGGVYASFVLRPQLPLADLTPLPLVVGVGAARGFERLGAEVGLKWPNDVVLAEGKLAGLLLEMSAESDRAHWVVAGIGANVRRGAASEVPSEAAYLSDAVSGLGLSDLAAALIDEIAEAYGHFLEAGFADLRAEYDRRHVLVAREVTVRGADGVLIAQGMVSGVDDLGRLLIETAGGLEAVTAGDVTLRRP